MFDSYLQAAVWQDSLAAEIEGTMRKELSLEDPECEEQKYVWMLHWYISHPKSFRFRASTSQQVATGSHRESSKRSHTDFVARHWCPGLVFPHICCIMCL